MHLHGRMSKAQPLLPRRRQAVGLGLHRRLIDVPSRDRHNKSAHTVCSCGHSLRNTPWRTFNHRRLWRLHVFNFHTAILACVIDTVLIIFFFSQISEDVQGFLFSKLLFYIFFFSFTMVIKWSLGGESPFGDRPGSSMSKYSAAVNSDLGNGSFGVEIRDAKHADRWTVQYLHEFDHINWPLTSRDVYFFGNACNDRVWKKFRPDNLVPALKKALFLLLSTL